MDPKAVSPAVVAGGSKLRHPLRLAAKSKDLKPGMADPSSSSASRRARPISSVSKSFNVLDMSGKNDSSAGPAKSNLRPKPPTVASISPISEARSNMLNYQGASGTPLSNVSRSSARRKFCVLSSVSYWVTHIRLSESASKHSVSLSFFKLALECGCEPIQRLREELKLYALRYNLVSELGELAEEVLQSYSILDDLRQFKASNTLQPSKGGVQNNDDDVENSGTLKPKSSNSESVSTKEILKKKQAAKKNMATVNTHSVYSRAPTKSQKQTKTEFETRNSNAKSTIRKTTRANASSLKLLPDSSASDTEVAPLDNKENMEVSIAEVPAVEEVVQTH